MKAVYCEILKRDTLEHRCKKKFCEEYTPENKKCIHMREIGLKDSIKLEDLGESQEEQFEKLFQLYWQYVYKYEVGYPEDWKPNDPWYKRNEFREQLEDEGMTIKVTEGY